MIKLFSLFILICISMAGVAISLVNTSPVVFNYYFQEVALPLSLLLIFTFILGVVITLILLIPTFFRLRFFSSKKKNKHDNFSTENLPLIKPIVDVPNEETLSSDMEAKSDTSPTSMQTNTPKLNAN